MKYLIKFNESVNSDNQTEEIQNFCNIYLVDLLDLGYEIDVRRLFELEQPYYSIRIENNKVDLMWSEIKDFFIPFFEFLKEKYRIKSYGDDKVYKTPLYIYVPDDTNYYMEYYTEMLILDNTYLKMPAERIFNKFFLRVHIS